MTIAEHEPKLAAYAVATLLLAFLSAQALAQPGNSGTSEEAKSDSCVARTSYEQYATGDKLAVVIDANTGELITTRTAFDMRDKVQAVFVHKNPMRYDYQMGIDRRLVEGTAIVDTLTLLGFTFDKSEAEEVEKGAADTPKDAKAVTKKFAPAATETPAAKTTCPASVTELEQAITGADSEHKRVAKEYAKATGELSEKAESLKRLQKIIMGSVPASPDSTLALCTNVTNSLVDAEFIAGFSYAPFLNALESQDSRLSEAIKAAQGATLTGNCTNRRDAGVAGAEALRKALAATTKAISDDAARLTTAKKEELMPFVNLATRVLSSPSSFVERRGLGPADAPTEYDIEIVRTDRMDDKEKKASQTVAVSGPIKLGSSRFSFSGGLGIGFADQKTFVRQPSITTVNDTPTPVELVGIDSESDTQFGVVAQLNGRIARWESLGDFVSLGWSLGASVTDGEDDTDFGLYTGLNVGFISDHLFITLAYHLQKQERLANGFRVGDTIPDEFDGELPTTEETEGSLLLSVTYRLRP